MLDAVDDRAALLDLRDAWHVLTPRQAIALRLWLVGYTQAEIGEIEGVDRSAISHRIGRALATLRRVAL